MKTHKVGIIIKHPYRHSDYRIDIYEIPEDMETQKLEDYVMSQMLGHFKIVAITTKINFNCKINA